MAIDVRFNAEIDQIAKKLKGFEKKAIRKLSKSATKEGADFMRSKQKQAWRAVDDPKTPEKIYANVTTRALGKRVRRFLVVYRGGVMGGSKDYSKQGEFKGKGEKNRGGDTFYWRFLEHGFTHTSHGKHGAKIAGKKIFKKTIYGNENEYKRIVINRYQKELFSE